MNSLIGGDTVRIIVVGNCFERVFTNKKANTCSQSTMATMTELFHDGGRYHIETSPLICPANQWTGFYMITASVMKELIEWMRHWTLEQKNEIKRTARTHLSHFKSCYRRCSIKKAVLQSLTKFEGKHSRQSLFFTDLCLQLH